MTEANRVCYAFSNCYGIADSTLFPLEFKPIVYGLNY